MFLKDIKRGEEPFSLYPRPMLERDSYICLNGKWHDLNYDKFFTDGSEEVSKIEDYHSHNTGRLDVEGMKKLLLKLRFIREDLGLIPRSKGKEIRSE